MRQLSSEEKEKRLSRLYWDMDINPADIYSLLNKETQELESVDEINFYCRLLSSCDWYTLLKLVPLKNIEKILCDTVIDRLYPKELKARFLYARKILSR